MKHTSIGRVIRWRWLGWVLLGLSYAGWDALALSSCHEPAKRIELSRLVVLINGDTVGYLRNCGCSSGQFGGELRKAYLIRMESADQAKLKPRDRGKPAEVLLVELGNFTDPSDEVLKLESGGVVESMGSLGYDSVGLGLNEMRYPQDELLALLKDRGLPLTACNLEFVKPQGGEDRSAELNALVKPYVVVEKPSGCRIGIIHAIADDAGRSEAVRCGFTIKPSTAAVQSVLAEHMAEADLWILTLANSTQGGFEFRALADMDGLSLLIGPHRGKPKDAVKNEEGIDVPFFVPGPYRKARDLPRAVVYFDEDGRIADVVFDRLPVSDRLQEDETVRQIVQRLSPELEGIEIERAESMLNDKGPHPWYVGHSECQMCHAEIVARLEMSQHAQAYEALREKEQHRSASCVKCHVVGHGTRSGWNVLENQPELQGVHCENCHGPGEYHVQLMSGQPAPTGLREGGRGPSGLKPVEAKAASCTGCHDEQNSVDFSFEEYWGKIEH